MAERGFHSAREDAQPTRKFVVYPARKLLRWGSGGRWMRRDGVGVLYTSLAREGALAEISFHWGQLSPRPSKPVMLHKLNVTAHRTLKLVRADLSALSVPENAMSASTCLARRKSARPWNSWAVMA